MTSISAETPRVLTPQKVILIGDLSYFLKLKHSLQLFHRLKLKAAVLNVENGLRGSRTSIVARGRSAISRLNCKEEELIDGNGNL